MPKVNTSTALELDVYMKLKEYCEKTGESQISVFERALRSWFENKSKGE
jgi:hypothetical protein